MDCKLTISGHDNFLSFMTSLILSTAIKPSLVPISVVMHLIKVYIRHAPEDRAVSQENNRTPPWPLIDLESRDYGGHVNPLYEGRPQ